MDQEPTLQDKIVRRVAELTVDAGRGYTDEQLAAEQAEEEPRVTVVAGFGYKYSSDIEKKMIRTDQDLYKAVKAEFGGDVLGLDDLYWPRGAARTANDWVALVRHSMEPTYDLDNRRFPVTDENLHEAIQQVRAENRQEQFMICINNLYMSLDEQEKNDLATQDPIALLRRDYGFIIEPDDVPVIKMILSGKKNDSDKLVTPEVIGKAIEQADENTPWIEQDGEFGKQPRTAAGDLDTLIKNLSGNLYSDKIGTIVGGNTKSRHFRCEDPSARIDTQNSPANGVFNVQYQVKKQSQAGVIFTDEDSREKVLAMLTQSLGSRKIYISPSAAKAAPKVVKGS
jgi:hypothetical protein